MKKILIIFCSVLLLTSCHHITLEEKASKLAEDYTTRSCPTPVIDSQRTDSVTFNPQTLTFNYYYTLFDKADNVEIIVKAKKKITSTLISQLRENTTMKSYKDAAYNFHYVYRSNKTGDVLYERVFTKKDYK